MAAATFGSKIIKTVASHPFGYAECEARKWWPSCGQFAGLSMVIWVLHCGPSVVDGHVAPIWSLCPLNDERRLRAIRLTVFLRYARLSFRDAIGETAFPVGLASAPVLPLAAFVVVQLTKRVGIYVSTAAANNEPSACLPASRERVNPFGSCARPSCIDPPRPSPVFAVNCVSSPVRLDTLHLRYGYLKVFSLFLRRLRPRQIRVEAANPQPSPPHALASPTSLPSLEQRVSSGGALVASSLAARLRSRRISRLALRCEIGVELRLGRRSHPRTRPKNRSFAA
ncbi:hypothetical protein V9T40_004794 [Parthenolecanium corni]|uniref:Uncharacterized protein n=1 Tax=Parthenolecanium corni TaxID=536013 RepID=A0AAN9Y231_9HEMI